MLILNPALTEDAGSAAKLLSSLQALFVDCAFFQACAEGTLAGDMSKDARSTFIQSLAASFLEAAKEMTETSVLPQAAPSDVSSPEARPGIFEAWVALLRTVVEEFGVDLDTVYDASGAAEALDEDQEDEEEPTDADSERLASLTSAQAWAEAEAETILDLLISKKILLEMPDMPFYPGCKVLAVLSDDDQFHPAVILREVAFADMWEEGYTPPKAEEVQEQNVEASADAEAKTSSAGAESTGASSGGYAKSSREKKSSSSRKSKSAAADLLANWCQNRFFEVRFLEFNKKQYVRFSKLMLNETIDDDEGVEGLVCEDGECEVCRRSLFLTFHHLIPKQTHARWLKRKRLPEGVRGYESGSIKMKPSSAVKSAAPASKKTGAKKTAGATDSSNQTSSGKDVNCNRYFLNTYGIMVCRQCHAQVHLMASNMELAKRYNTLERVLSAPLMQRRMGWKS
eukprot:TRINITY_DN97710_c0_g1_i1.p1 TRINITY_DN97710_c0_g1~~TRINITY_DN97710_c0_g1_i1.p1  ORF type:complete len:456 (+),score=133.20 TRINITY_DN97710_c0_g1_i1:38-1405(+)